MSAALVVVLFAALAVLAPPAEAHACRNAADVAPPVPDFPLGRDATAALWTGSAALVFGGRTTPPGGADAPLADIVRYDPVTNSLETLAATLPEATWGASAVWTGSDAFVFGVGSPATGIARYDPATGTVTTMSATLPEGLRFTSAVWTGTAALVIGGFAGDGARDTVLRYEPATDTLTRLDVTLPSPRGATAAFWDGTHAIVLGGDSGAGFLDEIVRVDLDAGRAEVASAPLPAPVAGAAVAWTGTRAILVGGETSTGPTDAILAFEPELDRVTTVTERLPFPRAFASAAWTGERVLLFGGTRAGDGELADTRTSQNLWYDPALNVVSVHDDFASPARLADARLPWPAWRTSATWTGTHAIVLLGDRVWTYDPAVDAGALADARLPARLTLAGAAWNGTHALFVGGFVDGAPSRDIHVFDPAADAVTTRADVLPEGYAFVTAAWTGSDVVAFGVDPSDPQAPAPVVRYDPVADALTLTGVTLPTGAQAGSAVWAGDAALVLAEREPATGVSRIHRYDPATNALSAMHGYTTRNEAGTTAVWGDARAYYFGGLAGTSPSAGAMSHDGATWFDPAADATYRDAATLPHPVRFASVVWTGHEAIVFGGYVDASTGVTDRILRFAPPPTAAPTADVAPGPGGGEVSITVNRGAIPAAVAVEGYRVYRETPNGGGAHLDVTGTSGTVVDQDLLGGTTHRYCARAVTPAGESAPSTVTEVTTPPTVPTPVPSLEATRGPGAGEITLTWAVPEHDGGEALTAYRVYAVSDDAPDTLVAEVPAPERVFTHGDLPPDTTRTYRVTAVNAVGESEASPTATATTARPAGAPYAFHADMGPGAGEITLTWQPPRDDGGLPVTGYRVYAGPRHTGPFQVVAELGNVTQYVDGGHGNGETRYYHVHTLTDVGEGASAYDHATTSLPPQKPRYLKAVPGWDAGSTLLHWSPPITYARLPYSHYTVYRAIDDAAFTAVGTLDANAPGPVGEESFADSGCPAGALCTYHVTATNPVGESAPSGTATAVGTNAANATTPPPSEDAREESSPPPAAAAFAALLALAAGGHGAGRTGRRPK